MQAQEWWQYENIDKLSISLAYRLSALVWNFIKINIKYKF